MFTKSYNNSNKSGIALAIVFIILVVLFIGGLTISQLMQGMQRQMTYADASIRCQCIAEAAMNLFLERLLQKPWEKRWFASSAESGADISCDDGTYDFFIHDTPGQKYHADLWITSRYGKTTRGFFWRIKYDRGLMGGLAQGIAVNRVALKKSTLPSSSSIDVYTKKVEKIITERANKRRVAIQISRDVQKTTSADRALEEIGVATPLTLRTSPFSSSLQIVALPTTVSVSLPDPGDPLNPEPPPRLEEDLDTWINSHIPPDTKDSKQQTKMKKRLRKSVKKIKKLMKEGAVRQAKNELNKLLRGLNKKYGAVFGSNPINNNSNTTGCRSPGRRPGKGLGRRPGDGPGREPGKKPGKGLGNTGPVGKIISGVIGGK